MQRRAAAIYAVFFLVIAAGSYAVIGVAEQPTVTVEDPEHTLAAGDTLEAGDRTYTVGEVSPGTNEGEDRRSVDLNWVNESARHTETIENDSTIPPQDVQWQGQTARQSTTFVNGSTVTVGGTDYRVVIPGVETPTNFTLEAGDSNQTYAVGDSFDYQNEEVTVTEVTSSEVTLVWGEPYRVQIEPATDPSSFALTQEFNVSKRLSEDPAVEDQTVNRSDGQRYVVYADNGSTQLLSEYLPAPEQQTFAEGESIQFRGNQSQVSDVSNESVELAWTAPQTESVSLSEGDVTTLGGTEYVAHFPDNSTLQLSTDTGAYEDEAAAVDTYNERIEGFWGISIISGLASLLLLSVAYLPSRY